MPSKPDFNALNQTLAKLFEICVKSVKFQSENFLRNVSAVITFFD